MVPDLSVELRDYALQVLTRASLAEKLAVPETLSDRDPGPAERIDLPARPAELQLAGGRGDDPLPGPSALYDAQARGLLLHRFANHELLALEIMARTLLAFPSASPAFRMGLARTMREEQLHLRLYLERMEALGVAPGAVAVNDFFWRSTLDIASPYDYLLRMPLTFEQANLDFTRTWRERFAAVGDADTVAVLDRVYADEIGHVRGGLTLFRAEKDPATSDFDAWERGLQMPLSPSRGRGTDLDREGRLAAGFSPEFIDRLAVWSRSRGRPPDVWCFNPSCEAEVAAGGPVSPDASTQALAADLAPTLLFLARREDAVLCPVLPSSAWLARVAEAGFTLAERVSTPRELAHRKLGSLRPWAWSPGLARTLAPLPVPAWDAAARPVWNKATAWSWRAAFLTEHAQPWLADGEGHLCHTLAEVREAADRGWLLKAGFSTAGRGRKRGPLDEAGLNWAARVLAAEGRVRAEPLRDRVLDLSFHFDLRHGAAHFRGVCRFDVTPAGQFKGTRPGRWLSDEPVEVQRFFSGNGQERRLDQVGAWLAAALGPPLAEAGISGPFGVDAFVYRTREGELRLDPMVEVNPRLTMGRVSLGLERRIHAQSRARWELVPVRALAGGAEGWWAAESAAYPLRQERGLLAEGVFATNDPSTARGVLGVLRLEPRLRARSESAPTPA